MKEIEKKLEEIQELIYKYNRSGQNKIEEIIIYEDSRIIKTAKINWNI